MIALAWALKHWKLLLGGLGALLLGIYIVSLKAEANHWHEQSDRYAGLFHDEQAAFKQTVANYRAAAELARAQDAANAARVGRDQAAITKEVSHDYAEKLAALHARYDAMRVRNGSTAAAGGSSGAAGLPEASAGSGGIAATAGEEGFPLDDRLICSAQAEQLDALIDWTIRQSAVSVDTDPPPG